MPANRHDEPSTLSALRDWNRWRLSFVLLASLVLFQDDALGNPDLVSLSPRSIRIGSTVKITASGKFGSWPVKIWCNRPGLEFKVGDKGEFTVTSSKESLPGTYLIRFLDKSGASDPQPLFVDSLESVVEKEPNESPGNSQMISIPANITGVLGKSGDVDCFGVECKAGQTLVARMVANPLFGKSIDGVIQICDQRGFVVDQNDDSKGIDPCLAVKILSTGKYFVRVFAFPATPNSSIRFAGGSDFRYLLTVTHQPLLDFVVPCSSRYEVTQLVPSGFGLAGGLQVKRANISPSQSVFYSPGAGGFFESQEGGDSYREVIEEKFDKSNVLQPPFNLYGSISDAGQMDLIKFAGEKGKKLRFRIDSRRFGMDLDPQLTVFDSSGQALLNKDDNSKTDPDLSMDFAPPKNGIYFLRIRDAADSGGNRFYYRLKVLQVQPGFELSLPKSSFAFKTGSKLEIEVDVNRRDGFSGEIELRLIGLPDHAESKPMKSEPKGATAKKVKLIVESHKDFQAECQVVGVSKGMEKMASFICPSNLSIDNVIVTGQSSSKQGQTQKEAKK